MKKYALKCPQCGANLEVDADREFMFCSFCGAKIEMDQIGKDELRIAEMEHEERMSDKELEFAKMRHEKELREQELKDDKRTYILIGIIIVVGFFMMLAPAIFK